MKGKTVVITGATSGIGFATASALARKGANLVLIARNAEKAGQAAQQFRAAGAGFVEILQADLASLASVARAAEVARGIPRIDVLINNAGGMNARRQESRDGYELTFAVNHLAHFVLTTRILDRLEACAPARIINVSSVAHRMGHLDFENLQLERGYGWLAAYAQAKLANVVFASELARRLSGKGVTANSLHPGVVATGFGRNDPGLFSSLVRLGRPLMLSPEQGARTSLYLASSPEIAGVSGRYFARCRPVTPSREAGDEAVARRLWEESLRLVRAKAPDRAQAA